MNTNLIQNFVHIQKKPLLSDNKKEDRSLDINHELTNKTLVKPLKGQGKLVKGNILEAPVTIAKDILYDAKALSGGLNGESNDHQLGRLNDLGMKVGGLAIAGYLSTKRQSPLTKVMEFVGLGSFFASMALWPKIAIQYPAQLIHGFNVHQQYEDSFGRKKPFFQDPQFLPWDLYSDDEINKIGDRLGVPRNIPNRREYIQEKMKKIAIQSNTLWMLTAGFATPIMSALICNALEKPLSKPVTAVRNSINNNMLKNFDKIVKKNDYQVVNENIERIVLLNRNKQITDDLVKEITYGIGGELPRSVRDILEAELNKVLHTDFRVINMDTMKALSEGLESSLKQSKVGAKLGDDVIEKLVPKPEVLAKDFEKMGYFGNDYPISKLKEIRTLVITPNIYKIIREYNDANKTNKISKENAKDIVRLLIGKDDGPIMQGLAKEYAVVLDSKNEAVIKGIASAVNELCGGLKVVEKYILHQLGFVPGSVGAEYWNNTVDTLVKGLKITQKELNKTRGDRLLVTEMLQRHYDDIAADEKAYNALVTSLVKQMSKLTEFVKPSDVNETVLSSLGNDSKLNEILDKLFKKFGADMADIDGIKEADIRHFVYNMTGVHVGSDSPIPNAGSYRDFYRNVASNRLLDLKASFFRILNSLDLHRRIASGDSSYYTVIKGERPYGNHIYLPREFKEDIVDMSKIIGISGHTADSLTKFFKHMNPNMDANDLSDIEIKNGKLVRKYPAKTELNGGVNKAHQKTLFVDSMRLQYDMPLYSDTVNAFGPKQKELLNEFKQYRKFCLEQIGNAMAFERKTHKVSGVKSTATNGLIFRMTGAATDEVIANYGKQSFNTNKWLRIFGTTGAVLLGLTVASQFFFGKMKLPQNRQTQETSKG